MAKFWEKCLSTQIYESILVSGVWIWTHFSLLTGLEEKIFEVKLVRTQDVIKTYVDVVLLKATFLVPYDNIPKTEKKKDFSLSVSIYERRK